MKCMMVSLKNTTLLIGFISVLSAKLCFGFQTNLIIPNRRMMRSVSSILRSSKEDISIIEGGSNPPSFEGSDMTITEYPHPVLRRMGDDITEFRSDGLRQLCKEMISIMYQATGVGLAAPQIGISSRLFVYNPTGDPQKPEFERIVCNPKILEYSDEVDVEDEGCLSSRSGCCQGAVCRACQIMVEYKTEDGAKVRRRLNGFEARVFQHEYDHIEGILHFDRFCQEDRKGIQPVLNALIQIYPKDDGVIEPDATRKANLQPMPLPRRGWIPPAMEAPIRNVQTKLKGKKKKKKGGKGGGGGFGKK